MKTIQFFFVSYIIENASKSFSLQVFLIGSTTFTPLAIIAYSLCPITPYISFNKFNYTYYALHYIIMPVFLKCPCV
jgi:hypothetical protein